jgi:CDP-diacylglycerol pyrophosphatase
VSRRRSIALLIASAAAALFAAQASYANRDALREIVQDQCLVHWRDGHSTDPCLELHLDDADAGYALLADRKGGAHFLLIPTKTITGIESPVLKAAHAPSYFQAAWQARARLDGVIGRAVPAELVGLAVNPLHARGQDQLHIHIECLRPDVHQTLAGLAGHITSSWLPVTLGGARYWVRGISGDLNEDDPFKVLASHPPEPDRGMSDYTLVVAGTPSGGFLMLASSTAPGELLLDSRCAAVPGAP